MAITVQHMFTRAEVIEVASWFGPLGLVKETLPASQQTFTLGELLDVAECFAPRDIIRRAMED